MAITHITSRAVHTTVYNFEVEGDHNYYITTAQLLVHNCPVEGGNGASGAAEAGGRSAGGMSAGEGSPKPAFMNPVERGRLPAYSETQPKTVGRLHADGRDPIDLKSGVEGPSQAVRGKGLPGFNGNQLMHVEGHAAGYMRTNGIAEADLEINRIPCTVGSGGGCEGNLPRMLPEGARLNVYGPEGWFKSYVGLPD
jgi:hypothetical protein